MGEEDNPVDEAEESLPKDLGVPVEEGEEFPLEQTSDLDTENPVTTPAPNQAFPDIPRPPEHQAEPLKLMGMKRVARPQSLHPLRRRLPQRRILVCTNVMMQVGMG